MPNPVLDQERVDFLRARLLPRTELLPAWPRPHKDLSVAEVDVKWVRFSTLNHRTKAEQLRAVHVSGRMDLFTSDPLGDDAQQAQYQILRSQRGFEDLKNDLRERHQQEPVVLSAEGVLINGNRRVAALRSLYQDDHFLDARYVRCLVLPEDATPEELVDLEAELQIAKDFKEEYSWVNEAMLIEELYAREGRNWEHVARKMHRDKKDVQALYDKLQQLHQLVALSSGSKLHVDFVENESAFDELAKHIKSRPKQEQESVRASYFLGTLSGVNYRQLRHLRRPDAADLIVAELETNVAVQSLLPLASANGQRDLDPEDDPLDELIDDGQENASRRLTRLLGFLATKSEDETIEMPDGQSVVMNDVLNSVQSAVVAAASEADEQSKDDATVNAPVARMQEALAKVDRASEMLPRARALSDWSEEEFQKVLAELQAKISSLRTA